MQFDRLPYLAPKPSQPPSLIPPRSTHTSPCTSPLWPRDTHYPTVIASAFWGCMCIFMTRYVSPAMYALDGAAREKGISVMDGVGLGPGIHHKLYALKT